MSVTPTSVVQMYLGGGWTTVSTDVRTAVQIVADYGIKGTTANDRIGNGGTLDYGLDNSASNSAATVGYYSLLHASKRTGFDLNIPVRWQLSYLGSSAYKFYGKLFSAIPTPGVKGERLTVCQATDWMDDALDIDLPDLATQFNQSSSQLVTTILDALTTQPVARSIESGLETYAIALDGGATGSRPKVREVLNDICLSEFGYCYIKGDPTTGGVFQFENRHHRAANPTVQITLSDTEIEVGGLSVPGSRDQVYRSVRVYWYPTRTDTAATTILFSLQTTSTLIQPGETNDTIFGPYRDPTNADIIGATAQVAPVATTDYTFNAAENGSGTDLTADFTVTASYTGLGVRYTITNNGATAGYITKLQARGKGIYRYEAYAEVTVAGSYGDQVFEFWMPLQNDGNVAADVAEHLASILATPFAHAPFARFNANRSATLMAAAILREPGDRIAVTETVTGLSHQFTINSVRLELQAGNILDCTWGLEPADAQHYWLLEVAGSSELDVSTYIGF